MAHFHPKFFRLLCLIFFCSLSGPLLHAQLTASLNGKVIDPDSLPLALVNITLHQKADSSFTGYAVSDEAGYFNIKEIEPGRYFLIASYIGFGESSTDPFDLLAGQDFSVPTIQFSSTSQNLAVVEVVARRPVFEIKPDKIVFNIEGTINADGSNALELLRKAPGVMVTGNDDIQLLGQSGVQIYINGKPSPLSSRDLASYLRTLQAGQIEAIEIISNPSSRYDAEGSAGIINIRLKRNSKHGSNTNINLAFSSGEKAWYYGGIGTNYRNSKWNIFGSYYLNQGQSITKTTLIREQGDLLFDQSTTSLSDWNNNKVRVGMDYYLSEESTLSFIVDGEWKNFEWVYEARTPIYPMGQLSVDSVLISKYDMDGIRRNMGYNLNYTYKGKNDQQIIVDADYIHFQYDSRADQPNRVLNGGEDRVLRETNYEINSPKSIGLLIVSLDHELPLWKGTFEAGLKGTFTHTDNTFDFFSIKLDIRELDKNRTNSFIYQESITAAYLSLSQQYENIGFQLGLRGERTYSRGQLFSFKEIDDDDLSRSRFDLFPSAGLTYQADEENSFQLNYSRRINRPSYEDLNPFEVQKDELNLESGNPRLNPEFSDKIQLTHSFNYQVYSTVAYSATTDMFIRIRDTLNGSQTVRRWLNLAEQNTWSFNIGASVSFAKWWDSYNSLTLYHLSSFGDYGEDRRIEQENEAFGFYTQQSISLAKTLDLELSAWYRSPSISDGYQESAAIWSMDVGIRKKFWEERARLSLSLRDIFRTSGWFSMGQFGGITTTSSGYSDSRRISVSFSLLLGNEKVKGNKRKTAVEEEGDRLESKDSGRG